MSILIEQRLAAPNNYRKGRQWLYYFWSVQADTIVLHKTNASYDSAVRTFQDNNLGNNVRSAHEVIADDRVAICVYPEDTAYSVGDFLRKWNPRTYNIEHEGWVNLPGVPDKAITPLTLDTSLKRAQTFCQLKGYTRATRDENDRGIGKYAVLVKLHKELNATSCPGDLDIDLYVSRLNDLLSGKPASNIVVVDVQPPPTPPNPPTSGKLSVGELQTAYPGQNNDYVKAAQNELKNLGYFPLSVDSTGYYGNTTVQAVLAFQIAKGVVPKGSTATLNANGTVNNSILGAGFIGPRTLAALNNAK